MQSGLNGGEEDKGESGEGDRKEVMEDGKDSHLNRRGVGGANEEEAAAERGRGGFS